MDILQNILDFLKKQFVGFWGVVKLVIATWIVAQFAGYFIGQQLPFVVVPYFLAGVWAVVEIYKRVSLAKSLAWSIVSYAIVFLLVSLTAYTWGAHSLLGMYNEWAMWERSVWGLLRIFGPIVVLTVGSVYFAAIAINTKIINRTIGICMILSTIGLLLHNNVSSADKWIDTWLKGVVQTSTLDRMDRESRLGICVQAKDLKDKQGKPKTVNAYRRDAETKYFESIDGKTLDPKVQYPYLEKRGEEIDGAYKMICILIPDDKGEFTAKAQEAWVRLDEVVVVSKVKPVEVPVKQVIKTGTSQILFTNTYTEADLDASGKIVILDFTKTPLAPGDILNVTTSTTSENGIVTVYHNDGKKVVIPENGWLKSTFLKSDQLDRGCVTMTFPKGCNVSVRTNVVKNS